MWWWVYQIIYSAIVVILAVFKRALIIEIGIMFMWLSTLMYAMLSEIYELRKVIERERCN
jgi:hypothetical protein